MPRSAPLPGEPHSPAEEGTGTPAKGHVLFVSRQRIVGRTNGSSVYLLDLAEAVRRTGFTPHLIQPSPDIMGRWPVMRLNPEMKAFETHSIRGVLHCRNLVISRDPAVYFDAALAVLSRMVRRLGVNRAWFKDRPRPYSIAAPWSDADFRYLLKARHKADLVIADYAFQAEAFALFSGRPSAIVMHDLFHRRVPDGDTDSVASIDRATEISLLAQADAVISIQSDEAQFISDHIPAVRSVLAPIAIRPVAKAQPGTADRLLFVGSNTAPNIVGLKWLFKTVWPSLRLQAPGFRLDIAGSVAAAFPRGGPAGVKFHGLVKDLSPLYASAGIVLSPLTFGSGLKIKLVEALAQGKAVVATSVTLQGVEQECEGAVMRADDAARFVDAILQLQDDDRRLRLAQKALSTAEDHFSPQSCHAAFTAWLEENCPRATLSTSSAA